MEKYLIHTCNSRLWYVEQYLIPSMRKQGIYKRNIKVYNDENGDGQLQSLINSYKCVKGKDTWHLQDDIIISSRFKEITEKYNEGIVCGFCNCFSQGYPGYANIYGMWYSMPCIRIPDYIFKGFLEWIQKDEVRIRLKPYFKENKHDDVLLEIYLKEHYPRMRVWNIAPNIVNHIDHLIGGSILNKDRGKTTSEIMSKYWNEPDLLVDIENKLKGRRTA